MKYIYNYTKIMNRDKKMYNFIFFTVPGGVGVKFLQIVTPIFLFVMLIGWLLSFIFNVSMFNFLSDNFNANYLITFIVIGVIACTILWSVEFSGYKLYEYLLAYLKPKKVLDDKLKEVQKTNIEVDGVVENIL